MLGVLWMDDSDDKVTKKIKDAAQRYRVRFGEAATICFANPIDVPEGIMVGSVRVEPRANIMRNHFLAGRENVEEKTSEKAA